MHACKSFEVLFNGDAIDVLQWCVWRQAQGFNIAAADMHQTTIAEQVGGALGDRDKHNMLALLWA